MRCLSFDLTHLLPIFQIPSVNRIHQLKKWGGKSNTLIKNKQNFFKKNSSSKDFLSGFSLCSPDNYYLLCSGYPDKPHCPTCCLCAPRRGDGNTFIQQWGWGQGAKGMAAFQVQHGQVFIPGNLQAASAAQWYYKIQHNDFFACFLHIPQRGPGFGMTCFDIFLTLFLFLFDNLTWTSFLETITWQGLILDSTEESLNTAGFLHG